MGFPFPFAGELSATASSLLWAVSGILFMRIRPQPGAAAINLGKNLTAVGCYLLLLVVLGGAPWPAAIGTRTFVLLAASGLVGLAICDTILFKAFLEIGPRRTNVYMTLSPALVMACSVLPPFSEHPPVTVWIGMAVCLAGIVMAVLERHADPVRRAALKRGARLALIAAVLQALGLLLTREAHLSSPVTVAEGATIRLVFGAAGLIVAGLSLGRLREWRLELAPRGVLRQVAFAAFLATFLGILTNQAGMAWSTHAGVAATLNALAPVWLIPLSAAFLGEHHDRRAWISALLAVGGIALMTLL